MQTRLGLEVNGSCECDLSDTVGCLVNDDSVVSEFTIVTYGER